MQLLHLYSLELTCKPYMTVVCVLLCSLSRCIMFDCFAVCLKNPYFVNDFIVNLLVEYEPSTCAFGKSLKCIMHSLNSKACKEVGLKPRQKKPVAYGNQD